jgi:hypothetical protein
MFIDPAFSAYLSLMVANFSVCRDDVMTYFFDFGAAIRFPRVRSHQSFLGFLDVNPGTAARVGKYSTTLYFNVSNRTE